MLNAALLSIHPEYVQRILAGTKHYEFRRINFKQPITHVIMYETAPTKLITGYFTVKAVHKGHPIDIWKDFGARGGIREIPFFGYYERCSDRSR
jgi:predicted transcriptional regulator